LILNEYADFDSLIEMKITIYDYCEIMGLLILIIHIMMLFFLSFVVLFFAFMVKVIYPSVNKVNIYFNLPFILLASKIKIPC